jgi:hypothetical protein
MIATCKERYAEDVQVGDALDLDGDEYGDNENAVFDYAVVTDMQDFYKNREPWITFVTSQITFSAPAGHLVKVRVTE